MKILIIMTMIMMSQERSQSLIQNDCLWAQNKIPINQTQRQCKIWKIKIQFLVNQQYKHIQSITIKKMKKFCPRSTSNSIYKIILILGFVLFQIKALLSQVTEYPHSDEYFDRIYVIQSGVNKHYLRLYCKQRNMLSLSITKQLQFQQFPRFPIHSPEMQTPRMQKKLYTFYESCDVAVKVNEQGSVIKILKKNSDQIIFAINQYSYSDSGDIQISTQDHSTKWGMGERFQSNFAIKDGTWSVWNRDRPWQIDLGSASKSAQTYGHQPVYLARSMYSASFHLVYFKNTYGFNIQVSDSSKKIKYHVTGGHIHFIIITGNQPEPILKQYHHYIGSAMVPPFWSMGYHQSRWGYKNYDQVAKVVDQFQKYSLPLDVMWSDLDYMDKKEIFTVDANNYPPEKMRNLMLKKRIHYIPLIDAGVAIADKTAVDLGNSMGVFIKSVQSSKQNYIGAVWPGKVHFVDYLHPNASSFWRSQLQRLYNLIPFSGVWLDMNEPSNFQGNEPVVQQYRIQHIQSINMMTINVNLNHYCKSCQNPLKHKQVHAYFGHFTTIPTYQFLKKKNGRPFIITRSNSVGTGVYAGHWTGDNVADWSFLRLSISGNFLFQIFGIQMVGADICGFHKNTNEELCSRWMQVGSFYPFARNHNENQSIPQQPYQFGNRLLETTKLSFNQRYSLLKQMYSTLLQLNGTGSFYRPLFFQFPQDMQSYIQQFGQTQFLIGDYLLGAPIVDQGKIQRFVYFPKGKQAQFWYQLDYDKNDGLILERNNKFFKGQTKQVIRNELSSSPPTFLRGGRLILFNQAAQRVADLNNRYKLIGALNSGRSKGNFLTALDFNNNTQIDLCVEKGCFLDIYIFKGLDGSFTIEWKSRGGTNFQPDIIIEKIILVEQSSIYKPINQVRIKKSQGREVLTLS